ncbi:MAG TPA: pyridoxamine 5'-phosphate oxidase family protein [Longimicrobiales bacterium]|nr:pyridoxamine 5'-phosphate oxidase family protein [Longimicrobiales bacterium]
MSESTPERDESGASSSEDRAGASERRMRQFASRPLGDAEVEAFLREHSWGVLATSLDDVPYSVPVIYGYDGHAFYVIMIRGKKTGILDRNPRVCLTIPDVREPGMRWSSVVVTGTVEWVTDVKGWLSAMITIRRQRGNDAGASLKEAARLARARVARIVPADITGRAKA